MFWSSFGRGVIFMNENFYKKKAFFCNKSKVLFTTTSNMDITLSLYLSIDRFLNSLIHKIRQIRRTQIQVNTETTFCKHFGCIDYII